VKQLNFSFSPLLLTIGNDPDVCADSSVVKHLFWQGDYGFKPVILNDPFANIVLSRSSATCEERRSTEDNSQSRPILLVVKRYGFELGDHVLQKKKRSIVNPRQTS